MTSDVRAVSDAPSVDQPIGHDVVTSSDVPATSDGSTDGSVTNDTDAATCTPTAGSMAATGECDQVQLAILRNGTATPTVSLQGRVNVGMGSACVVVDTIDVMTGTTTLATLTGTGVDVPADGSTYLLATGSATTALTALCASDANRFDGVGLVVHGRMNGGAYTSMCGNNTPDTGWPPRVVVTCHTGITSAPLPSDGTVMSTSFMGMTFTMDQIFGLVAQPPTLMTIDPTVHIIPGVSSFGGGMTLAPSDTTGWMGGTSTMVEPTGPSDSNISLFNSMDVLGTTLCPTGCLAPPCTTTTTPPVFLARMTGTSSAGAYETELYVQNCTRAP